MVWGPKGCSRLAFSREKRGLGAVPGPLPSPAGPAAPDPIFFLCQGDRGAPGELGEIGEKVRQCQSRIVPFSSIGRSWCPCSPAVLLLEPMILDATWGWALKGFGAARAVGAAQHGGRKAP